MASRGEVLIACYIEIHAKPMTDAKVILSVDVLGYFLWDYMIDDELFE